MAHCCSHQCSWLFAQPPLLLVHSSLWRLYLPGDQDSSPTSRWPHHENSLGMAYAPFNVEPCHNVVSNAAVFCQSNVPKGNSSCVLSASLVWQVERLGVSACIMGSRGFGAAKRSRKARLGSVSDYCVHHCKPELAVGHHTIWRWPDDAAFPMQA